MHATAADTQYSECAPAAIARSNEGAVYLNPKRLQRVGKLLLRI